MPLHARPWCAVAVQVAFAALLASCATVPPAREAARVAPVADQPFSAAGRLSARHGTDAVTAGFQWRHAPPRDELELATPLGQTVARLSGDAAAPLARVELADGRVLEATDWASLTERTLGFPLPVAGLAAWVRGGPHAGSPYSVETDGALRVALLRQDGWEIGFDYGEGSLPSRLRMTYPGVEVRIALERLE